MKIKCPIPQCGQENPPDAAHCSSCGTNLQAYSRLLHMPDDLFNRGLSFSQGGHFQQAEQYLQSALLFNPRDQETLLLLAQVQALRGNRPGATETFTRVLEKGINDPRLQTIAVALQAAIGPEATDKPVETAVAAHDQPSQPPAKTGTKKHKHKRKRH